MFQQLVYLVSLCDIIGVEGGKGRRADLMFSILQTRMNVATSGDRFAKAMRSNVSGTERVLMVYGWGTPKKSYVSPNCAFSTSYMHAVFACAISILRPLAAVGSDWLVAANA